MYRTTQLSLLALTLATASSLAHAAAGIDREIQAIGKAGIPLTQAVTIAEQHVNGKATQAEFEHSRQGWVYDVEIVSGTRVFDVLIDADKGTVLSSVEDKEDHE
ncbi:MAG: PepSY domain-containing protein [Castellaniella sp.]|uniref:PepSY domain-containing protein n=1 Tax=Castellaniella sp. TaxID=1955812 RepID=UPI003A8BD365